MIFRRDKKRKGDVAEIEEASVAEEAKEPTEGEEPTDDAGDAAADGSGSEADLADLDSRDWRGSGPYDIAEVEDLDSEENGPRIDLGSMILTGVPGSELRLQVAEDTQQIVSAMLIIETIVEAPAGTKERVQTYSSALELGAYAAPRSGGLWTELREEIAEGATEAGGSVSIGEGPFGVEVRRLVPVTTPDGEEGYQPSRMWVAEGPRWLLRGIVYGQAAIEEDLDSPVVADVLSAFRQVVIRRGDEAMAPGDLLPLAMPAGLVSDEEA
jgi:hypothetical protein